MSQPPPPKPPGWYPDPHGQAPFRWWDGTSWTQQTSQGQNQQSQGGVRGWKLFLIITAAIVAAVVILVVGCSALVSSSLDSGDSSGSNSGSSEGLSRADLPAGARLIKRARDKGENPDFGLDASFPPSRSRYFLLVETDPPAKITAVNNVTCRTEDYSKSVNRDLDISDILGRDTSYGVSFKLPKGWKPGWTCDLTAMGQADSTEGSSTTVVSSLYRAR